MSLRPIPGQNRGKSIRQRPCGFKCPRALSGARSTRTPKAWIALVASAGLVASFAVLAESQEHLAEVASRYFDRDFLARAAQYHRFNRVLF
ncbi:MAG: hypothetical protein ACU843_03820, partial [Gammaproteobacteria bacterium]